MRELIKADGTRRAVEPPVSPESVRMLLGADTLDTVVLRHLGHAQHNVMLVDGAGYDKGLPVNVEATRLYHANCLPGTEHVIRGDVVVLLDDDFAPAPHKRVPLDPNCAWPFPGHVRGVGSEGGETA